ncbi:MAG: sugar phosphate isomerase/epimerase [Candidatus Lokiarchaeota archaeon]|nr:sugar phosphate isomerase/epimerase [Candidatus Lokiarchaeota archaeon]
MGKKSASQTTKDLRATAPAGPVSSNTERKLRFGITVDIQAALELALGGGGAKAGIPKFDSIDPIAVVRQAYERHGIKVIELPADANYVLPNLLTRSLDPLSKLRDQLGLEYTIHLPFFNVALTSFNQHVRAASIETIVENIKAGEQVGGINNYVLHLTSEIEDTINWFDISTNLKELAWGLFLDKVYQSLEEIISRTGVSPAKICVENMEGVPFSRTSDILVNDLGVSICLDVGHAILQGEEHPIDFMNRWKDKVHEIHLHNVWNKTYQNRVRVYDDHHGIKRGAIDMGGFLHHLESMGYAHPVLLEIQSQAEVAESIAFLRESGFL